MVTIYILECKGGKYYVGKIKSNVYKRIKQHFDGKGAKWTKKYKPIDIVDIRRNKRDYSETLITLLFRTDPLIYAIEKWDLDIEIL